MLLVEGIKPVLGFEAVIVVEIGAQSGEARFMPAGVNSSYMTEVIKQRQGFEPLDPLPVVAADFSHLIQEQLVLPQVVVAVCPQRAPGLRMARGPADCVEFMVAHHAIGEFGITKGFDEFKGCKVVSPFVGVDQIAEKHQFGFSEVFGKVGIAGNKTHMFEQGLQLVMLAV